MTVPKILDVEFQLQDIPHWHDDCDHPTDSYQFSFSRRLTNKDENFCQITLCDAYLYPARIPFDGKDICIRFGEKEKYLSTYWEMFIARETNPINGLDTCGFVHNMLWLTKVHGVSPTIAFEVLDTTRWYVHKTKLGYAE